MKTKILKSILAAFLVASFIIAPTVLGDAPRALTAHAADDVPVVRIDKTYLTAGEALSVDNPADLTLEYYVGEQKIETDSLVLSEEYFENWITVRGYDGDGNSYEDSAYFAKLPVIYIGTDVGRPVTSKLAYKPGTMFVQNNTASESVEYNGAIQIKGRGNTSWTMPKKPYRIKLDKKADLFGLGANKNWVLISNYLDESLLRNKTAYELSRELGLEYMDSAWCDVIFNGEYVGCYLLCEQIRIDETRVNIFDWEAEAKDAAKAIVKAEKKKGNILDQDALEEVMKSDLSWITTGTVDFEGATYSTGRTYDDLAGGFLFELSDEYDEISKFTTASGLKIMLKSPEYLNTNEEMTALVEEFWGNFENAYRSEDGYVTTLDGTSHHYTEYADLDSMVSYWLVMEIMGNVDGVYKSRFAYMDLGSLLKFGPAWDFDWGSGSLAVSYLPTGWKATKRNIDQCFFNDWVDDPFFMMKAIEKYWEIRPYLESVFADGGALDGNIAYLSEAGLADGARWDRKVTWPDKARGFETDAEMFRGFMQERLVWLDSQFSSDKRVLGSTNSNYSSFPYTKSNKISFEFSNTAKDTLTEHVPADAMIACGADTQATVRVSDDATVSLNVYINGLFYDSFVLTNGAVCFDIDAARLTEAAGRKNMVSVIGKDASGATTVKNYYTLTRYEPEPVPGDANGDSSLDMKDVLMMRMAIAGIVDLDEGARSRADLNANGSVDMADVLKLRRIIAGIE